MLGEPHSRSWSDDKYDAQKKIISCAPISPLDYIRRERERENMYGCVWPLCGLSSMLRFRDDVVILCNMRGSEAEERGQIFVHVLRKRFQ